MRGGLCSAPCAGWRGWPTTPRRRPVVVPTTACRPWGPRRDVADFENEVGPILDDSRPPAVPTRFDAVPQYEHGRAAVSVRDVQDRSQGAAGFGRVLLTDAFGVGVEGIEDDQIIFRPGKGLPQVPPSQ